MFNECHIHLYDCTCLNVFSHAQYLLIKHKIFLSVLVVFGKYFVFAKIVKIFKNNVALFWWLSRGLVQWLVPVASPYRDFSRLTGGSMSQLQKILRIFFKIWIFLFFVAWRGDLFTGGGSSCEGYTEIITAYLTTLLRVELLVAKNTWTNFSKFVF